MLITSFFAVGTGYGTVNFIIEISFLLINLIYIIVYNYFVRPVYFSLLFYCLYKICIGYNYYFNGKCERYKVKKGSK